MSSLRRNPLALRALFAVVGLIAAFAYAINAWQVFGFAKNVWELPLPLCFGASVVADALSLAGLFATYLLRGAPSRVRAYAWFVFLGMTGLSILAAESFARWRDMTPSERAQPQISANVAAAAIVVALALATHLLIIANRHGRPAEDVDLTTAERVAGVAIDVLDGDRHPGVYRALGENDATIYVGSTVDLAHRISQHKNTSGWFPLVKRWTFEPYPTMEDAEAAERVIVEAEQPAHNKNLKTSKQPKRHSIPEGVQVSTVEPSVNVAGAEIRQPPPRRPGLRGMSGRKRDPEAATRRDEYAKRVVDGERPADVAKDAGVSKRAVELWAKAYRDREAIRETAPDQQESVPSEPVKPAVNGHVPDLNGGVKL